jgi:hypothetical protein
MEIEQRYVVRYIHRKGMKLPVVVVELAVYTTKMHSTKPE